jgi:predicted CXXCH cytochrome family protein
MKPRKSLIVVASLGTIGVLAWAVSGDITGSAHDFSSNGFSQGQICLPCHTPHHSNTSVDAAPLWNHELTTATYTTHSGAGIPANEALDPTSILCMSCHDGTVALDSFGGVSNGVQFILGDALLGTDIEDDHPIGADAIYRLFPWMNNPVNWEGSAAGNPRKFRLREMTVNGAVEDVVSCGTCHEPHNGEENPYMLQLPIAGSQICLECHLK